MGVQVLREDLLVDLSRIKLALLYLGRNAAHGFDNFGPSAIAEREDQGQPVVMGQGRAGFLKLLLHKLRQAVNLAHHFQLHVVTIQFGDFTFKVTRQILHQHVHFFLGPVPIFDREGVQREIFDVDLARRTHHRAHGLGAMPMAFDTRQTSLFRPAPIAVHDDGHMRRQQRPRLPAELGRVGAHEREFSHKYRLRAPGSH